MNSVGLELLSFQKWNVVDKWVVQSNLSLLYGKDFLRVELLAQRLSVKYSIHLQRVFRVVIVRIVEIWKVKETCQVLSINIQFVNIISNILWIYAVCAFGNVTQVLTSANYHRILLWWWISRENIDTLQLNFVRFWGYILA